MVVRCKQRSNESGQAFFEFILFTPFLIALMLLLVKISAAINGSINQQKATRGYFYYLIKNDSMAPDLTMLYRLKEKSLSQIGFYALGWRERVEGEYPLAPCYKLNPFIGGTSVGECDEKLNGETKTNYIKPVTVYGLCTASYQIQNDEFIVNPLHGAGSIGNSCSLL